MQVSKKHLTGSAQDLIDGIRKTAAELKTRKVRPVECVQDFENIIKRFTPEELHKKYSNVNRKIMTYDFLTMAWMYCATPWIVTEVSERKTKRKSFSATHNMKIDDEMSDAQWKKTKRKFRIIVN
jgi:hypothetical protein